MTANARFDEALQPIRDALEADGYAMDVTEEPGGPLAIQIRALESACEECLVPSVIMRAMIDDSLSEGLDEPVGYVLVYPDGSSSS